MAQLPPALAGFASLLNAQPQPVREIFQYCLCLMLVEAGKMRLLDTVSGEAAPICIFASVAGETFSVPRPPMSQEQEAEVLALLREIPDDEGLL
jgi:hypothetical protein